MLARWRITYLGRNQDATPRVVRVHKVQPNAARITGFCELRQAERTFSLHYVRFVEDADTGLPVNLADWLAQYRKTRKVARPP